MNNKQFTRIIATVLALVLALSTGIIVLAEDYGMQGANDRTKLQMTKPSDITVNSASEAEFVNTINTPVGLTEGVATFEFKMTAFGGQTTGEADPVPKLQSFVNGNVAVSDENGNAVSDTQIKVVAADKTAFTFSLAVSGLSYGKTYTLTFLSTFTTGGSNWALKSDIKFCFTTVVDPKAPYVDGLNAIGAAEPADVPRGVTDSKTGYAQAFDANSDSDTIGFNVVIRPKKVLANEKSEQNCKQFSLASYYGENIPVEASLSPSSSNKYTIYRMITTLSEPGWYCLTVGKDLINNEGKTIGDYTGGKDQKEWILKPYSKVQNEKKVVDYNMSLTTNLQNITYEDTSAYNFLQEQWSVAMVYYDENCPDYLVKLTAAEGYTLPSEISISVKGKELTAGKDYAYTPEALQKETGLVNATENGDHEYNLKVDRHAINGPVVITAAAVKTVTGVTLDKTELKLDEGDSATLTAIVSPEDASNKNVAWTSSDEKVVTVDETGKVTAVKAGTATITVTTEDGEKTATCAVTVNHKHVEEVVPGKAATCTEKGLTDGKKCSVCGEVLEAQKDIPALGHDFKDGKCTRCDAADPDFKPTPVEPDTKFTGLANEADKDGNWWYYTDGKIDKTHTGVDQNKYGWWRVENGKVNFKAQGIYQNKYGWWKTTDGEVTFKENSIYQNEYGWWKCKDSKDDFTAQSIYQNQYGWWKTTDGKVTFKENGLFKNQYGTWKVENSKVNFNYNGTYQGKTIKNGKVQ